MSVVGQERAPRVQWRWAMLFAAMLGIIVVGALATRAPDPPIAGASPAWNIELSASGTEPVRALVFGEEAGIHLVSIPATGAPVEDRRRVAARLAQGDVYLMSLGRSPLQVRTSSPAGIGGVTLSADARFVKLFQRPDRIGITTGWW
jgi:hypothetical protein